MAIHVGSSLRTLGIVGMCVNGLFLCICIWRLVKTLMMTQNIKENRVMLHITLFVFAVFEFIYLISFFVEEEYTSWGYAFHLLALICYIAAFCLIFTKWERTLGLARGNMIKVGRLAVLMLSLNVLVDVPFIILVCIDDKYIVDSNDLWPLRLSRLIVESTTLMFSTVWLFAYSIQLNDRLSRVTLQTSNDLSTRFSSTSSMNIVKQKRSVRRIVVVLFFCCLSYFLRILCLLILVADTIQGTNRSDRFDNVGWFFLSNWVPTLVPGLLFLYTSRVVRTEAVKNKTNNALQDMFKEDFDNDSYYDDEDVTTTNPVHSTDIPSVNIDGIERPSGDYEAEIRRNRESVESLPPGHSYTDNSTIGLGQGNNTRQDSRDDPDHSLFEERGQYAGSVINMTPGRGSYFEDL